jgi:SAM-dependent methyltransferase
MNKKHRTSVETESWGTLIDRIAMDTAAAVEELRETSAGQERQGCAEKLFTETMDALWLNGADRLQRLFPDSNTTIKQYYLERIIPVLKGSVFHRRASGKPRGYAGDFLTMDMIYSRQPLPTCGTSPLSAGLDYWFLDTPSARACRNRHDWLVGKLGSHCGSGPRHVASLACGPCREIKTLLNLQRAPHGRQVFDLFDFDEVALEYARTLLEPDLKNGVKCNFYKVNLFKTALTRKPIGNAGAFDLIYCAGFADYLDDRVLVRLLEGIYKSLAPGGTLLLAQFLDRQDHPDRNAMQWGMNWNLIYRTEAQLNNVFSQARWGADFQIDKEPLGLIALCRARKPK